MYQFARFAATRAGLAIITLVMVSFIVFSLMELVPGDCAERYLAFKNTQGAGISVADIDAERVRLGKPDPHIRGEPEHAHCASATPSRRGSATPTTSPSGRTSTPWMPRLR